MAKLGDVTDVEDRLRRLDHRPEFRRIRRENLVERVRGFDDVAWRVDLGQQDAVGGERAGKLQIVRAPFAGNRVDTDDDLRPACRALFHESGELFARDRLLGGSDRVLQIEDHRVAGER